MPLPSKFVRKCLNFPLFLMASLCKDSIFGFNTTIFTELWNHGSLFLGNAAVENWFAFPSSYFFFFVSFFLNLLGEFWVFIIVMVWYNFVRLYFRVNTFIHPAQHGAGPLKRRVIARFRSRKFLFLLCWLFMTLIIFCVFFFFSF